MLQKVAQRGATTLGGGLVTFPNYFLLQPDQTPNVMDVKFSIGGIMEKRLGSTTLNATVLITSAATGFNPDSGGTLGVSLQAFWALEEQSGSRFDSFGVNTLSDQNSVGFSTGIRGNAASFVSANSQALFMNENSAVDASGQTDFTLSGWFLLTTTEDALVVGKVNSSNDFEYLLETARNNGSLTFSIRTNSGSLVSAASNNIATNANTGRWIFVSAWHNSVADMVNLQVGTGVINSAGTLGEAVTDSTTQFRMGMYPSFSQGFNGRLDQWGVWKKVLTSQERIDLYNGNSANTYSAGASNSGFGSFDFGAGTVSGQSLRWLIVAAGTGLLASSNRGTTFVAIATDRGADYQEFERSKNLLIAVSNTGNRVLTWSGSVGTFMLGIPIGSAPPAKHALDFNGYLFLMNDSGGNRRITYADNNTITTSPWTSTFEIPSSQDDEIAGGVVFSRNAYVYTKYTVSRVSPVGGNPDFSVLKVKDWGAVPRTIKKATYKEFGEVMICLSPDRHVRIFDGSDDQIISTQIEQNNGRSEVYLENLNVPYINKCHAEVDTNEQVYRLWLVMTPSTETTHCLCLNLRTGAWYPYANQAFNSSVMAESGNSRLLVGVRRDGFVHSLNSGNLDGVTPVNEFYESPYYFKSPRTVTKTHKLTLYYSATSSGSIFFQDRLDYASTFPPARDLVVLNDTVNKTIIQKVIDVPFTQNVYEFRLTSSASTAMPWKMSRVDLEGADVGLGVA